MIEPRSLIKYRSLAQFVSNRCEQVHIAAQNHWPTDPGRRHEPSDDAAVHRGRPRCAEPSGKAALNRTIRLLHLSVLNPLDGRGAASCMLQIHIYSPPSRPNSVLKISSHPPPLCRSLGCPGRCGSPFFVWLAWGRRLRSRLLRRQLLWSSSPRRSKARWSRRLH
jgi:hypothetical protein